MFIGFNKTELEMHEFGTDDFPIEIYALMNEMADLAKRLDKVIAEYGGGSPAEQILINKYRMVIGQAKNRAEYYRSNKERSDGIDHFKLRSFIKTCNELLK